MDVDWSVYGEAASVAARELAEAAAREAGIRDELAVKVLAALMEEACDLVARIAKRVGTTNEEVRLALRKLKRRGLARNQEMRGLWCATAEAYLIGLRGWLARAQHR